MTDYQSNTTRPVHPQDPRNPADRGTTVVNNERSGSGWVVALLVAVALGIGAVFMFTDFSLNGDTVDVDVTAPTSTAPATDSAPAIDAAPAPAAPVTPAPSTDAAPAAPAAPAPSTTPAPAGQ